MIQTIVDGLSPEQLNDRSDALTLLAIRRSASVKAMTGPGPTPEQVSKLLELAVRVPSNRETPRRIERACWTPAFAG